MESDREVPMASKAGEWLEKYTQEEIDQMREECIRLIEEMDREKMARDEEVINSKDREAMIEDYNAEEMNIIAKEKMQRRRRERFVRHFRRRSQTPKKNSKSSSAEESFTSDSDDEMSISVEEMKRLMEKAIQENMTWTLTAKDEVININDGEAASKAEEINMADEKTFPRRRGRLIRYLRRQSSKPQDSAFQIEDHHLQLPMAEQSFMSYSDESDDIDKGPT